MICAVWALLQDHFIQQSSVCWFLGIFPLKCDQSSGLKYVKQNKKNKQGIMSLQGKQLMCIIMALGLFWVVRKLLDAVIFPLCYTDTIILHDINSSGPLSNKALKMTILRLKTEFIFSLKVQ